MHLEELVERYVEQCVDDMDLDALCDYAMECMSDRLLGMDEQLVIAEINEYYPELLED